MEFIPSPKPKRSKRQKTIDKIYAQTEVNMNSRVFVPGNSKLGEDNILIFNLPPVKSCQWTSWCINNCYGTKGNHAFPNVLKANESRLQLSLRDDFVEKANIELDRYENKLYIRIHSTGDFYSIEYVEKWIEIVKANPNKKFLAFTKQYKNIKALRKLAALPNMSLFESLDEGRQCGKMSGIKKATVYNDYMENNADFVCPGGCPECGYECWNDIERNVVFHKH